MLWFFIMAAGAGLLLGLVFRVAAVIAASVALALSSAILGPALAGWGVWQTIGAAFGGVLALQGGYTAGLLLMMLVISLMGQWSEVRDRLVESYRALSRAARVR